MVEHVEEIYNERGITRVVKVTHPERYEDADIPNEKAGIKRADPVDSYKKKLQKNREDNEPEREDAAGMLSDTKAGAKRAAEDARAEKTEGPQTMNADHLMEEMEMSEQRYEQHMREKLDRKMLEAMHQGESVTVSVSGHDYEIVRIDNRTLAWKEEGRPVSDGKVTAIIRDNPQAYINAVYRQLAEIEEKREKEREKYRAKEQQNTHHRTYRRNHMEVIEREA